MLIVIFGESCVGKSTVANALKEKLNARLYTGKDYLRLAKGQAEAEGKFKDLLKVAVKGENLIWVVAEKSQLLLAPEGAVRILMTADIDIIKERFSRRTGGKLPPVLERALEEKHGIFDGEACDFHIDSKDGVESLTEKILNKRFD